MRDRKLLLVLLLLAIIGAGLITFGVLSANYNTAGVQTPPVAGSNQYPANPAAVAEVPIVQLDGKWSYKQGNTAFVAEVKNGGISIDIVGAEGDTLVYWVGTFNHEGAEGVRINSIVDTNKTILSIDNSKVFTIGHNTLSFEFQAMAVKKTVVMTRG